MEFRWQESAADLEGLNLVLADVYQRGKPLSETDLDPDEVGAVCHVDDKVVGAFLVVDFQCSRGLATLPCAGVAAVAVLPEVRHLGVGSSMMRWSLGAMRERGYVIANLYPFRESYYRKFGYESAGTRVLIECPRDRMPDFPVSLPVRRVAPEQVQELDAALVPYGNRHSGVARRTADNWKRRMGSNPPMIYAFGDPVEAYLWTAMDGTFWDDLSVGELVYSTPRGYESALGFLRTLGINRGAVQWSESTASPFLAAHVDGNTKVSYHRQTMWRILDVQGAFTRLHSANSGSFTFAVQDPHIEANTGVWQVSFAPGSVSIKRGQNPDFSLTIGQLTQAFLGEPSLSRLASMNLIEAHNPAKVLEAELLLSPMPTLCSDYF